jgi:hypothetical protein
MLDAHNHRDHPGLPRPGEWKVWRVAPPLPRIVAAFETPTVEGNPPLPRTLGAFETALNKSAKPIVSESFTKSLNNRTHAVNAAKINQPHQSSAAQVS